MRGAAAAVTDRALRRSIAESAGDHRNRAFCLQNLAVLSHWRGDYAQFMLRRVLRLWPVYAFALIIATMAAARPAPMG